jgi:LEA14-like dessication related protein
MFSQVHLFKSIGLALLLANLTGCASWFSQYEEPQVHLLKVQVVKAHLLEQSFKLNFRIDNPNDRGMWVRGLSYKILLNDVQLAEGDYSDRFRVAPHTSKYFVIPIKINLWQHLKYLAKLLEKPRNPIHYRLEGKLKTGLFFGRSVRIERDGEIIPGDLIPEIPK